MKSGSKKSVFLSPGWRRNGMELDRQAMAVIAAPVVAFPITSANYGFCGVLIFGRTEPKIFPAFVFLNKVNLSDDYI